MVWASSITMPSMVGLGFRASGERKVDVFLSLMFLNGKVCAKAFKAFEYGNAFDNHWIRDILLCLYTARRHHHRMLKFKMW